MIVAIGDIYARIADRDEVAALMRATQDRAREQPGCSYYVFAETLDDPGHFVLVEHWDDRAALDAHYRSPAFADYQEQVGGHLVRASELRLFEVDAALTALAPGPIEPQQDG
jgi:quinol monooxygenase YgiN